MTGDEEGWLARQQQINFHKPQVKLHEWMQCACGTGSHLCNFASVKGHLRWPRALPAHCIQAQLAACCC